MSSLDAAPDIVRSEFAAVRQLRDELQRTLGEKVDLTELSMGMSGDFGEAIEQGSTCVRIGTSLWAGVV